jgi:hypothetical protein
MHLIIVVDNNLENCYLYGLVHFPPYHTSG